MGTEHRPHSQPTHDLDDWSRTLHARLVRARQHRTNETELREDVDRVVIDAAADLYGLSDLGATAERAARPRASRKHYDKLYWGVVVEWEWRLASDGDRDHAGGQALDYLALVREGAGEDEAFTCVVTNGEEWGFLATSDEEQEDLFSQYAGTYAAPVRKRFEWRINSPAACRRFLELIGSHRQQAVTGKALASSFGPASDAAKIVITLLSEALGGRNLSSSMRHLASDITERPLLRRAG